MTPVKFWSVEEPFARMLPKVPRPDDVMEPVFVRFVTEKFVVVALVPVAFTNVKFCKVEEPDKSKLPNEAEIVGARSDPPVIVIPPVETIDATERPPENVEVAVVVPIVNISPLIPALNVLVLLPVTEREVSIDAPALNIPVV